MIYEQIAVELDTGCVCALQQIVAATRESHQTIL